VALPWTLANVRDEGQRNRCLLLGWLSWFRAYEDSGVELRCVNDLGQFLG